jgi:SAM-dependent methyltransferase
MKGRRIMADIVKIEYVEMEERLLIGIAKAEGMDAPMLWGKYFEGGYSEKLGELLEYQCEDITEDYIGIGYATDFKDDKSLGNEYIIGRYFNLGTPVPDYMTSRTIPKGIIAKAQVRGKNLDDIINNAYMLINDMVKRNGYSIDYRHFYWSEVYTYERYCIPADKGQGEIILDWYMPCIKEMDKIKKGEISAKEHYDNLIDDNNDPVNDPDPLKGHMEKWDGSSFIDELGNLRDSAILEIGVGTGRLALQILAKNCKYFVGVDISEKTIIRARENLAKYLNHQLVLGDYLTVDFETHFDIIYSSLTFFHFRDKIKAIQKTWDLLYESGKFVLSLDKNKQEYLDYGKYKVKLYPDDLSHTVKLLKDCGFLIINTLETEFAFIVSAKKSSNELIK